MNKLSDWLRQAVTCFELYRLTKYHGISLLTLYIYDWQRHQKLWLDLVLIDFSACHEHLVCYSMQNNHTLVAKVGNDKNLERIC